MTPTIIFLNANGTQQHIDIVNGLLKIQTVPALAAELYEQFQDLPLILVFSNFVNSLADEVLTKVSNGQRLFNELNLSVVIR